MKHGLYTLVLLCMTQILVAQLPEVAIGRPKVFEQKEESPRWEDIARNRQFGEYTRNAWTVYIASDGVNSLERPQEGANVLLSDLRFMEGFKVAQIQGDYAQLYYNTENTGVTIPDIVRRNKARLDFEGLRSVGYVGWVPIDKLLLWNIAPRTNEGVYQKIAIVKDIEKVDPTDIRSMPELYMDDACQHHFPSPKYLDAFGIYFLLKYSTDGNALVCKKHMLSSDMHNEAIGWVNSEDFISWNMRICWEPAFGQDVSGSMAYTFFNRLDAINHNIDDETSVPYKLTANRRNAEEPRSPVTEYDRGTRVAHLSVLANMSGTSGDPMEARKKLRKLQSSMEIINIVFVIDATNSMDACFSAMRQAMEQVIKADYIKDQKRVNFGVVAYRNYDDHGKAYGLVECCPLTDQYKDVIDFLSNIKCTSVSRDPQEAMFYGMNYALENLTWKPTQSNFMILISDVTTKDPDAKGLTASKIASAMAKKQVNLVAFQARSAGSVEYVNYASQVREIIVKTLHNLEYPTNIIDYDDQREIMLFNAREDENMPIPYRPMGYKKKDSDDNVIKKEELIVMSENIIRYFIDQTLKNIAVLENAQVGVGTQNESLARYLRRQGINPETLGAIRVYGYARRNAPEGNRRFVPCVFMTSDELSELIKQIETITGGTVTNVRGELQQVCQRIILSYTGQYLSEDERSNVAMFETIAESIELECGCLFRKNVINHVVNPQRLSDTDVEIIIAGLRDDLNKLKRAQNNSENYFMQGKFKYYYVLLDDMPLMKKNR